MGPVGAAVVPCGSRVTAKVSTGFSLDFLARLAGDKQMSRFFVGVSADSLKKLRQNVVDQLCKK